MRHGRGLNDRVEVVQDRPDGYLTTAEFAARVGHSKSTVHAAYARGRFPRVKLRWLNNGTCQDALLIAEDQIPMYLSYCRSTKPGPRPIIRDGSVGISPGPTATSRYRPSDLTIPGDDGPGESAHEPASVSQAPHVSAHEPASVSQAPPVSDDQFIPDSDSSVRSDGLSDQSEQNPFLLDDLAEVKLLKEQIETRRKQLELMKAGNQLIEHAKAASLWRDIAVQTRQNILSVVPRLAVKLANESDVHKCSEFLKRELIDALTDLSTIDDLYKLKNSSSD